MKAMMTEQRAGLSTGFYSIPVSTTATPAMTPMHAPLIYSNNRPQINIKLVEPEPFNGNTTQACVCLSTLKRYFIAIGLTYKATGAADTLAEC